MKITYNKLEELEACVDGLAWFKTKFGTEQEVKFKELLKCNNYEWIAWLIRHVPAYQTSEHLDMYLSMKPDYINFSSLIRKVPACQTKENLKLYLSMNPSYLNFSWSISQVPAYQTKANYEILKQMEKDNENNI